MRICFFNPFSLIEGGGVENWMIRVSRFLSKHHKIGIVGLNYSETRRLQFSELAPLLNQISYYEFPSIKPPIGVALPNPLYLKNLLDVFNFYDLTYIIIPNPPIELLLYFLKMNIRSKLIAGFHGFLRSDTLLQRLYTPLFRKALNSFKAYHVLNQQTYFWLKEMCNFNNIFYMPNGADTSMFQLCDDPSNSQAFNILFSGRLTEDKGADILVEIIRFINEKLKLQKIKFMIVGSGTLEYMVKNLAEKYSNIHYLGFLSSETLPAIYRSGHLFLIPSRTEGMPLSLLEAQSCGLPAIGSNIPGISDIIINGKNGQLVKVGDINAFAKAIRGYYELWRSSPAEYYRLNRTIRKYVVNNYDWNIVISKLERMFMQVLKSS
jgi:glycosyltransferase involved in cell wall biosynthesis